jgi:hypothetical protein
VKILGVSSIFFYIGRYLGIFEYFIAQRMDPKCFAGQILGWQQNVQCYGSEFFS